MQKAYSRMARGLEKQKPATESARVEI